MLEHKWNKGGRCTSRIYCHNSSSQPGSGPSQSQTLKRVVAQRFFSPFCTKRHFVIFEQVLRFETSHHSILQWPLKYGKKGEKDDGCWRGALWTKPVGALLEPQQWAPRFLTQQGVPTPEEIKVSKIRLYFCIKLAYKNWMAPFLPLNWLVQAFPLFFELAWSKIFGWIFDYGVSV